MVSERCRRRRSGSIFLGHLTDPGAHLGMASEDGKGEEGMSTAAGGRGNKNRICSKTTLPNIEDKQNESSKKKYILIRSEFP